MIKRKEGKKQASNEVRKEGKARGETERRKRDGLWLKAWQKRSKIEMKRRKRTE